MKNQRKTLTALGVFSAIAGAGALVSAGLLSSLHSSYKVPYHQTYFFSELKKEVEKTQDALKTFSISENNKNNTNEIKNLFSEIDYAKQLLANIDSSVALMLKQRNVLKQLAPKAMLSVVTDASEQTKLINEYYSLVKDVDFKSVATQAKDKVIASPTQSTLTAFYSEIDPFIKQQNEFSFALETKVWTDYDKLLKNNSETLTAEQKSALDSTIQEILNLLNQNSYSRDALREYGKVYDQVISTISVNKTSENEKLKNFLKNVIHVRNEIGLLNIKDNVKKDFFNRIDTYKKLALSPSPRLAITKDQEINYLNDLVNNQLDILVKEQNDDQVKNMQLLASKIQELKNSQVDENVAKLIASQIELIEKDVKEHPRNLLNNLSYASNLDTSVKNIKNLTENIKSNIAQYLNDKNISSDEANDFNVLLNQIIQEQHQNINDYLEKLNQLNNKIKDNSLLSVVFKESLKTLKKQIENLLRGSQDYKNDLIALNNKLDHLINNATPLKDLNDGLRILTNDLRNINRKELTDLYNVAKAVLNGQSIALEEIKERLAELNNKAKNLIKPTSAALREDLQFLIGEYKKRLSQANISDDLRQTYKVHAKVTEEISKIFGGEAELANSEFGKKLLQIADDLKKQAEILSLDPNPELTEKDKSKKLFDIREQLQNLQNNAQHFKDLEAAVASGNTALESSKGKTAEQTALEKEALKIKQLQNDAFDALNNAQNQKDVSDIVTKLQDAIKDYKDKQANYQSTSALNDKFKEIEDTFAPYAPAGKKTPTQENLTNKLKEYQKELTNPNLTNEERDQVNDKIAQLINVVGSFKDLEVNNNGLKELIKDTEFLDFASFKPESEYTKAKNLNAEVDTYLVSAFNLPFNRSEIESKIQALVDQSHALALAISVAFLNKINSEIQANKITDATIATQAPYQAINDSITTLDTKTKELIAKVDKTQEQVDELTNKLKNFKNLAVALKNTADKLHTINQTNNPNSYQSLLDSITNKPSGGGVDEPNNSLINFNDSPSVIEFKIRILNGEVAKTDTRVEVENHINQLKNVYSTNERNRVIFDEAIATWESKITEFTNKSKEFYSSRATLASLRDEVNFYITRETNIKNSIQKEWDDVVAQKTALVAEYNQRKNADGLTNITNTGTIFSVFDTLKEAKTGDKFTTTTASLSAKLKEVPLGYAKDLFTKDADAVISKLDPFDTYNNNELKTTYSQKWKSAITTWVNALKAKVNGYGTLDDILNINLDHQKLSALELLIDELKDIFTYLDTNAKSDASKKNYELLKTQNPTNALFTKLASESTYNSSNQDTLYALTPDSTITLKNELRNAFFDVVDLVDAKAAMLNKISTYKTTISNELDNASPNIDAGLKTQITNKLDGLKTQTEAVTTGSELVTVDNSLSDIKFKQGALKQLAIRVKASEDLVTNQNANQNTSGAGKTSIITSIQNVYNSFKNDYLILTASDLIAKEQDLANKAILLNNFVQVYANVQQEKTQIPMSYPDGTGQHGTGAEGKQKMEGYYDHLINDLNTEPVTESKLFATTETLASLNKLIQLQNDKIQLHTQVKDNNDYKTFNYKTGVAAANYGFETDANKLADDILQSIPDNAKTASNIDNELYPTLASNFQNKYDLYLARKEALDLIYKQGTVDAQKGIKTKQVEKITTNGQIDATYNDLKAKMDDFFHTQATSIQNATTLSTINDAIRAVAETDFFFDKYKEIAELLAKAKAAKALITSASQSVQSNANVTESLQKLEGEITKGEGYYYTEKDEVKLDNNIFFLKTYVERLKLAEEVAKALETLDGFNTNSAQGEYLTDNAKAPLRAIINKPFTELKANASLENEEEYKRLLITYVTGSGPQSFSVAFLNSKELQATIHKAQQYLDSYNTQKASNPDYEPANIANLYATTNGGNNTLEAKIAEATNALNNINHDEAAKVEAASAIFNSNNGILDEIFKAEAAKIEAVYRRNLELDKFMIGAYLNANNANAQAQNQSPRINDYEAIALEAIQSIDTTTPQKLVELNSKYNQAIEKYYEQALAVFQWEAHRYKSYKDRIEPYTGLFNDATTATTTGTNAKKEFILKVAGVSQNDVSALMEKLNPTTADTLYKKAKDSFDHLATGVDAIKMWLKEASTNANLVIEELHEVGTEFLDYFQNLISITSVPLLGLTFSQLEAINSQIQDTGTSQTIGTVLRKIEKLTDIQVKTNPFNTSLNNVDPNLHRQLEIGVNEQGLTFEQETPARYTNPRTSFFNKYKQLVTSLAVAKERLESFVFGDNPNDTNTLKNILHRFILGEGNYEGRANLDNLLKYIEDATQLNITGANDKFKAVKDQYAKLSDPAKENEALVAALNKDTATDFDIYDALTKGFSKAATLIDWMNDKSNTNLFFDYLSQVSNGILNYANIVPKDLTFIKSFQDYISKTLMEAPEISLDIDGSSYDAKKLNGIILRDSPLSFVGGLFEKFNVLKGNEFTFNNDNVEVYVYKAKPAQGQTTSYVTQKTTNDTSIRRGFINLYFKFKKPSNLTKDNSAFFDIQDFGVKFDNVGITFKTLDRFVIDESNIRSVGDLNRALFNVSDAGWNKLQAPYNLSNAFTRYSTFKARTQQGNNDFFIENVDSPLFGPDTDPLTQQFSSGPDFRIKVKLTNTYKTYRQQGNVIYWKTLTPNIGTGQDIQYQNQTTYRSSVISTTDDINNNWHNQYEYQYDASTDANANLVFLPIVIGIPVRDAQGNDAIMVISWQILNRFDYGRVAGLDAPVSLGDNDRLRYVYFFKPSTQGKNHFTDTSGSFSAQNFYSYVMNKIKYRDLVGLTFTDLRNSGLWGTDNFIIKDSTNSGKGGVGDPAFYTAIGNKGRFELQFKLH
ncbi:hypothetical protein NPA08_03685 [Mycoplasmopsis citelli]|uniref:hypothetical protein n=1 Tax=Mycoplasmopsis citelli TaxID=171281 RepID=UPI002113FA3F|nr:hypothetical protein [Mycoplasmopsis citelli]UUD36028.1 hypothetical protein NPA08_03685 [Mycoplasmopsis citelli]